MSEISPKGKRENNRLFAGPTFRQIKKTSFSPFYPGPKSDILDNRDAAPAAALSTGQTLYFEYAGELCL